MHHRYARLGRKMTDFFFGCCFSKSFEVFTRSVRYVRHTTMRASELEDLVFSILEEMLFGFVDCIKLCHVWQWCTWGLLLYRISQVAGWVDYMQSLEDSRAVRGPLLRPDTFQVMQKFCGQHQSIMRMIPSFGLRGSASNSKNIAWLIFCHKTWTSRS